MTTSIDNETLGSKVNRVYDLYRTAILNSKYYADKLDYHKKRNFVLELAISLTAPAGLAGLAFLKDAPGSSVAFVLAAVAGILAIIKPVLDFQKSIERYTKLWTKYVDLSSLLEMIVAEIQAQKSWNADWDRQVSHISGRLSNLAIEDDETQEKAKVEVLMAEVNIQIPAESLWVPPEE